MSFPRYPEYKDSGVEWLGEVPAHWEIAPLKRAIARIESGTSVNAIDVPAAEHEYGVLKTSCVYDGEFDPSENKAVVAEEYERVTCSLRAGTLIVSRMNTPDLVGAAGLVREAKEGLYLPDRLWQVHFSGTNPRFMHRWTQSSQYRSQVQMACSGTSASMQNLAQDQFRAFLLALPPVNEQAAIATFLDRETAKIDALIAEQERLIELLKEKRQAVISHAVTKGLDPDVPMRDSGVEWLGEVPAHWDVVRLKFMATVQTGVAKGKDYSGRATKSVPYLRVANVQDGYLDLDDVATIEIPEDEVDRYRLRAGDVLMNEGGDFDKLGRGHVWSGEREPCIHQNHVFAVRPNGVSSTWINLLTGSAYAQFYFMSRSKQSTNLASISSTNIMELPLLLPPSHEQELIAAFARSEANKCDDLVEAAELAIAIFQERRAALISAAVTGQIDVRDAAPMR